MLSELTSNGTERSYHQEDVQFAKVESSMVCPTSDSYRTDSDEPTGGSPDMTHEDLVIPGQAGTCFRRSGGS